MRARTVAIECGTSRSVVGAFNPAADGELILEEYAFLPRAGAPAEAAWPELSTTLRQAARFAVTPAANLTITKQLTVPALARAKRDQVVRFEAAQAIPRPLAEVVWDWAPVAGKTNAVELVAMRLNAAESLCAAAERSGIRLEKIVARASSLALALRHNYPELAEAAVLAEIDGGSALLVCGGRGAARARLVGLPAPIAVVAGAAESGGSENGDEPRWRRLAAEMVRCAGEGAAADRDREWQLVLLLAGADAPEREVVERFAGPNGARVERFDALRRVRVGAQASGAAALAHQFGAVVGTALAAGGHGVPNLLPMARRRENAFRRNRWRWLAAVGALVVALWGTDLWLRREVGRVAAEVAATSRALEPWREAQREVAERRRQLEACQRELTVLAGLERAQTSWATFLGDTQERLARADGVWLETMQLQPVSGGRPGNGNSGRVGGATSGDGVARLRVAITGCALDPGLDGRRGLDRLRELLREWPKGPMVAGVEAERFDTGEPGLLRFSCVLVLNPEVGL